MSITVIGLLGIVIFLFMLLFLGMPVGFTMAVVGFGGIWYVISFKASLGMVGSELWNTFSSYGLTMVPLFVFMGQICFYSGLNKRLFKATHTVTGHVRGGLAMATIFACSGFAAICGSNTATAATMTAVALPEMKKYNYNPALSVGSIACGSTLGVVIPPSLVLILVGLYTGQSISKLFYGGILAGLLLAASFMVTIAILCWFNPDWSPLGQKRSLKEKIKALPGFFEALLLFALVMGGLYAGVFTPTEAGAVGTLIALVIGVLRRKLTWQGFTAAVIDTLQVSCMVFVIIAGAVMFSRFLAITRIPFDIADWVAALPFSPVIILSVIFIIYIIGGALMDALALLLITIPIFFPVAMKLGYDPIWFGVMITIITTLGAVTPPVGASTYVVAGIAKDIGLGSVFRGVLYFLPAYILCIILFMAVPQIITYLPSLIR
ncbi:MAG: TRAP transporter large permease [Deltaproteobacteria bacterium]|nr:TRAP transporter large permease [Deltaproteobacteria bacterium]MBW2649560.1 TRAP transporter large permease [Deltaproteobacteria bacterium]